MKDDRPFGLNNRVHLGSYGNIYYGLQLKDEEKYFVLTFVTTD